MRPERWTRATCTTESVMSEGYTWEPQQTAEPDTGSTVPPSRRKKGGRELVGQTVRAWGTPKKQQVRLNSHSQPNFWTGSVESCCVICRLCSRQVAAP